MVESIHPEKTLLLRQCFMATAAPLIDTWAIIRLVFIHTCILDSVPGTLGPLSALATFHISLKPWTLARTLHRRIFPLHDLEQHSWTIDYGSGQYWCQFGLLFSSNDRSSRSLNTRERVKGPMLDFFFNLNSKSWRPKVYFQNDKVLSFQKSCNFRNFVSDVLVTKQHFWGKKKSRKN